MRKIKFRGKTLDGRWIYGDLWHRPYAKDCVTIVSFMEDTGTTGGLEVIPETVGQYTGLEDMNDVEIYEGDIVAFEDSDGGYEYQDLVMNTGIVEYGELRFYFTNRVAVEMGDFYIKDGRCDDIEVIGNIYDNPELLKGEQS